jgi:hypothetical protein
MDLGNYSKKPKLKDCIEFVALRIARDKLKCPQCQIEGEINNEHECLLPWEECVRKYFCEEINILLAANKMKYDIPIKDKLKEILNGVLNYF